MASSSKAKLRTVRQQHRVGKHPEMSMDAYSKLPQAVSVMRKRVPRLNWVHAKRLRAGGDNCGHCLPFT